MHKSVLSLAICVGFITKSVCYAFFAYVIVGWILLPPENIAQI